MKLIKRLVVRSNMRMITFIFSIVLFMSCSNDERAEQYVGYWQSENYYLIIERVSDLFSVSIFPIVDGDVYDHLQMNEYYSCRCEDGCFVSVQNEQPIICINTQNGLHFKGHNLWKTAAKKIKGF